MKRAVLWLDAKKENIICLVLHGGALWFFVGCFVMAGRLSATPMTVAPWGFLVQSMLYALLGMGGAMLAMWSAWRIWLIGARNWVALVAWAGKPGQLYGRIVSFSDPFLEAAQREVNQIAPEDV